MIDVTNNAEQQRYEATIDGAPAGFSRYHLTDELITFSHTEVDLAYEGRGVGSAIFRFALDEVRADGTRKVYAMCPFMRDWLARHGEYADLVYDDPEATATRGE